MSRKLPTIVVSSGEPAGIGPDLCLMMAEQSWPACIAVVGNAALLKQRASVLGIDVEFQLIDPKQIDSQLSSIDAHEPNRLVVIDLPLPENCVAGQLHPANAQYVIDMLTLCTQCCLDGRADAMVTAPVHKGIINQAGIAFSGHTELLAQICNAPQPVMVLCTDTLRVALATTHLPLKDVAAAITPEVLEKTLSVLHQGLIEQFKIAAPRISVCGLNPHAGEDGYLGREEIDVIRPTLDRLRKKHGWVLHGPLPADTLFTPRHLNDCDAVLAMYHDQGLPVLKFAGFGSAVNVTLGLPIIRTSVDHGTAIDLAASGTCDDGSMKAALKLAINAALDS